MVRNLKKQQYEQMIKNDYEIRNYSQGRIISIQKEIDALQHQIDNGDSSEDTKSKLEQKKRDLKGAKEIKYGRD